jgi:uncharacterized membrane protein HdeD (DUF308 family)
MTGMLNLATLISEERERLRRAWFGFVALGILLVVLGVAALVFVGVTTLLSVLFLGWFFLISGAAEVIHAIIRKGWSGFWLDLISGVITALAGLLIVMHPFAGASVLTILIGVVFLIGGIFRLAAGIAMRNPYAGLFALHGAISLLLGALILVQREEAAIWVIGTLVGVDLVFNGIRLIAFGLAVRRIPAPEDDDYRTRHTEPAAPPPAG